MTVTVVSTANQAAAKAAGEKIDALFPVTKDSADAINEASGAYKSLTDAAKKLLPDAEEKLAKAEADYKKVLADAAQDQADRDAAAAVDAKIEAIGTVTLEKEGLITAARSAYEGLSDAAKDHVTKLGVLEAAEAKLNELKNARGSAPTPTSAGTRAMPTNRRSSWQRMAAALRPPTRMPASSSR